MGVLGGEWAGDFVSVGHAWVGNMCAGTVATRR